MNHRRDINRFRKIQPPKRGTRSPKAARSSENQNKLPSVVCGILGRVVGPLLGQVVRGKNRRNRAHWNAGTAIDTLHGIDKQLLAALEVSLVFLGMNAVHRARVNTGSVFGSNTGFSNYVSHNKSSLEFSKWFDTTIVTRVRCLQENLKPATMAKGARTP